MEPHLPPFQKTFNTQDENSRNNEEKEDKENIQAKITEKALEQLSIQQKANTLFQIPEMVLQIVKNCDLKALEHLCSTHKATYSMKDKLLENVAMYLNIQLQPLELKALQIYNYCNNIKQQALNIFNKNPDFLPDLKFQATTFEEIKILADSLEGYNTWMTWYSMANSIKTKVPSRSFLEDSSQHEKIESNFENWVDQHKGQLSQSQELKMDSCQISSLPEEIEVLENLQVLSLRENQLQTMPHEISNLKRLEDLDLTNNQIEVLPEPVCQLTELKNLYLDGNKVVAIPSMISLLKNLEILNVNENALIELSSEIAKLTKLNTISLKGNPNFNLEQLASLAKDVTVFINESQARRLPYGLLETLEKKRINIYY